ncbi:MAG: PQQ-dependent sugar dehydrogenase [Myxococcales bacterium]|nr:PQQ-dependent sugar dehydrogenase [Myxococcales bacterium]
MTATAAARAAPAKATAPATPPAPAPAPAPGAAARAAAATRPPPGSDALAPVPAALAATLRLTKVMSGLRRPVLVTAAPGEPGRLYVVEQAGAIRVFEGGVVRKERFLDLIGKVSTSNEQGLLGLAFHPRYADNRKLYVHYTDRAGDTRIVEYRANSARTQVEPASARELLAVDQPYANHNGGHLAFGPDGKLYTGLGDGGSAGDPKGSGQSRRTFLGKLLRLDVDGVGAGSVGAGSAGSVGAGGKGGVGAGSAGGAGGKGRPAAELVHWGLRNPWRFAFDSQTGDLFIGDVGQSRWESVHVVGGGDPRSHNFGWNIAEGNHCYNARTCDRRGLTPPIAEYSHDEGCSITGGVVYRGKALPELAGAYFYADYCTSLLRSFRFTRDPGDTAAGSGQRTGWARDHWDWRAALDRRAVLSQISSFGTDSDGELYLVSLTGTVWKLERQPAQTGN